MEYLVGERDGRVEVCVSLDTAIATPLTVYVEATQQNSSSSSATGLFIYFIM